jgi:hypothetical protein
LQGGKKGGGNMVRAINTTDNQLFTFDVYSQAEEVVFYVSLLSQD